MVQTAVPSPRRRRADLVRAAAALFSAHGYHGTSMQDLGGALGLQRGSLYAHIGSKEELLYDVVEEGADRFLDRAEQATSLDEPAPVRLRALLVGHIETAAQHLDAATVFLNEWRYLSDDLRATVQGKRDRYEAMVRRVIADGVADGDFRPDADINFAATLLLSAGNWTYTWYRPDGDLSPTQIGEKFIDLMMRGLEWRTNDV
ncbi:MAG: TetR/AcrR family transcriptional regulator [Actinobacteria bacterium]|nr:TetR/AcrR family transcriptional regulator [Actinomycetota bacterium]